MKRKLVNYGNSFEKLKGLMFPQNPMLVHQIQDNLTSLMGNSLMDLAYSQGAKKDINSCIDQIVSDYKDNADAVISVIGYETWRLIKEYKQQSNG